MPPSKVRRVPGSSRASEVQAPAEPPQPPVCPHCNSKFASHNNLRRHIIEVHKRYEVKDEFETKIDKVRSFLCMFGIYDLFRVSFDRGSKY